MNYSDLKSFFDSDINATALELLIRHEVNEYKHDLEAKRSVPITLNAIDGEYMIVNRHHFEKVCRAYIDGFIDDYEMFYIADVIMMSEEFDFVDEEMPDLFSQITDPEINGTIDKPIVTKLLESLKKE